MAVAVETCQLPDFSSTFTASLKGFDSSMAKQRWSTSSDASQTTLNAHSTPAARLGDTASRSSGPLRLVNHHLGNPSLSPAMPIYTSMAPPPSMLYPSLTPSPVLTYPMGTTFAPQSYFPPHSLPPTTAYSTAQVALSAYAAPFVPQAFQSSPHPNFNMPPSPYMAPQLPAHHQGQPVMFPPQQSQHLQQPFAVRPRAASDRPTPPSSVVSSATQGSPRSNSFTSTGPARPKPERPAQPTYALDDDDERPLAEVQRRRNDSSSSSAASSKAVSLIGSSNASSRSITPTPDAADPPRASMSTARGVAAASSPLPQHSPSLHHHRSAPSLARPSPLSQERFEDEMLDDAMHHKPHGLGRLKKAFTINTSSETVSSPGSSTRGHERGSASVTSNTSFSSASTSPPRTPPDPGFISPCIYAHPDAESSTVTLPSDTQSAFQPKKKKSLFSSKMNTSTDNISISSTVSSASMMIRKIGSFGSRLTKRGSLGSIGSMFHKDKDGDAQSLGGSDGLASKLKKKDRKKSNLSSASLSHVHAEQESPPRGGMTPAKALVQQQQQLYAEQEAAEAARAKKEAEEKEARAQQIKDDKRLKAIEKEKEKLKGRRVKKWGLGSFGGGSSISYASSRELSSQEDLTEFGASATNEADISHTEHATPSFTAPRVPVPSFLEDRAPRPGKENASFSESTSRLFNDRWAASSENVSSYFEDDSTSHFDSPDNTDTEGSVFRGKAKAVVPARSPLNPHKPIKGILKTSTRSNSSSPGPVPPFAQFERARSNSYNESGSTGTTRDGFAIHPDHFVMSPAGSGTSSPIPTVQSQSPYRNPALNVSAPILQPQPHAPYLASRSVTAPPGKRLAFAPNLSVHTTWPAAVYDRRSEPATCNKLTPAIAQRIKEELNAFKLNEMDVHQTSRIYTHFFA